MFLASGSHLRKMIIKNGKPTVVADYATVYCNRCLCIVCVVNCCARSGSRHLDWCGLGVRHYRHHFRTRVRSPSSLYPRLSLIFYRNHSSHFENAKTAFEEGGGRNELADAPEIATEKGDQDSEKETVVDQLEKGKV
jgi:MFS transporter, SHS family, lactate transporter